MYEIKVSDMEHPHEEKVEVRFEKVAITFRGDKAKEDAYNFIIQMLKETGRVGY